VKKLPTIRRNCNAERIVVQILKKAKPELVIWQDYKIKKDWEEQKMQ